MAADRVLLRRNRFKVSGLLALVAAATLTGCAATTQQNVADADRSPLSVPELPAFRDPGSIRPTDQSIAVSPHVDAPVARPPTLTRAAPVSGPWAPTATPRAWRYIVLHHSASPSGNAAIFDREHRNKGWDELGYHFVINNGQGGPDGSIEIGPRWRKQKYGAHAKTPDNTYNNFGVGICFVGNFENSRPTQRQLASAARLVAWLEQTYRIPAGNILGHEDTGKSTLCPGRNLSVTQVRTLAGRELADAVNRPSWEPWNESAFSPIEMNARIAAAPTQIELLQSR